MQIENASLKKDLDFLIEIDVIQKYEHPETGGTAHRYFIWVYTEGGLVKVSFIDEYVMNLAIVAMRRTAIWLMPDLQDVWQTIVNTNKKETNG